MKNGIKNTLIFLAGATVGTVSTAFACRSFYIKYYNETITDAINTELDNIKNDYDKKLDEMEKKYQANLLLEAGMAIKAESDEKKEAKKNGTAKKGRDAVQAEAVDYTKFSQGKTGKTVADIKKAAAQQVETQKPAKKTTNKKETKPEPKGTYSTNFESFMEDNGYEKLTYTYFAGDQVYVDEFENPDVDMPGRCDNIIKEYEDFGGDASEIYARNDELESDFEIIYNEGTYAEWIKEQ